MAQLIRFGQRVWSSARISASINQFHAAWSARIFDFSAHIASMISTFDFTLYSQPDLRLYSSQAIQLGSTQSTSRIEFMAPWLHSINWLVHSPQRFKLGHTSSNLFGLESVGWANQYRPSNFIEHLISAVRPKQFRPAN